MCNDAYLPDLQDDEGQSDEAYAMHMFDLYQLECERADQQADLPLHQRDGYSERMNDAVDHYRQQMKDERIDREAA